MQGCILLDRRSHFTRLRPGARLVMLYRSLKSESVEQSHIGGQGADIGDCAPIGLRLER